MIEDFLWTALALLLVPMLLVLLLLIFIWELVTPEEWRMSEYEKEARTVRWLEEGHEIDIVTGRMVNSARDVSS